MTQPTNPIEELLSKRILILDGAMGTMIQKLNLEEHHFRGERFKNHPKPLKGNNDLLTLTQPEKIAQIHRQYLDSGADLIETNTFSSNAIAMEDYGLEDLCYELNVAAARLAKSLCQEYTQNNPLKPRFAVGSIGPTSKTASLSPDVSDPAFRAVDFETLREAYATQCEGLIDGGVDVLLVETIFDTLNAKAALFAISQVLERKNRDLPIMVSGTITDASGRTLSGQTLEAFLISISHVRLLSVGLNCALGAGQLFPYMDELSRKTSLCTSVYPNAGLPNAFGGYDQGPQAMAMEMVPYLEKELVNIVGGCCGTTPEHIEALSALCNRYKPRKALPVTL